MGTGEPVNPALVTLWFVELQHILMCRGWAPLPLSLSSLHFLHSLWNTALKTNQG